MRNLRFLIAVVVFALGVASGQVMGQSLDILMKKATEAYYRKNYSESEQYLRKIIEINPQNAAVYNNLGLILQEQEKYEERSPSTKKPSNSILNMPLPTIIWAMRYLS